MASGDAIICCGQETAFFEALAEEIETPPPGFLDLRDRAAWSAGSASKLPKMSALVAEACLVPGAGETARAAADRLKDYLNVTLLLSEPPDGPLSREFDVVSGRLRRATGALGQFEVTIDALRQPVPGGRGDHALTEPRNGGLSHCGSILDLSGGTPLFPAPEKREGYCAPIRAAQRRCRRRSSRARTVCRLPRRCAPSVPAGRTPGRI